MKVKLQLETTKLQFGLEKLKKKIIGLLFSNKKPSEVMNLIDIL